MVVWLATVIAAPVPDMRVATTDPLEHILMQSALGGSNSAGDRELHLCADREVLLADREQHELFDLVLARRTIDRDRLGHDRTCSHLEISAHHEAGAMRDRVDGIAPLCEIDLGGGLD